jgi:hypothetical protein
MKEVRKLYQEWNVPDPEKWRIPVIESPRGIEAVFGSFFGFKDRFAVREKVPPKQKDEKILVFSHDKDGIFE